jgi:hypothetical protein
MLKRKPVPAAGSMACIGEERWAFRAITDPAMTVATGTGLSRTAV